MAKKKKSTKKKCCEKYLKKGKHCSKCPIVDTCDLPEKVDAGKKKKEKKKKTSKKKQK